MTTHTETSEGNTALSAAIRCALVPAILLIASMTMTGCAGMMPALEAMATGYTTTTGTSAYSTSTSLSRADSIWEETNALLNQEIERVKREEEQERAARARRQAAASPSNRGGFVGGWEGNPHEDFVKARNRTSSSLAGTWAPKGSRYTSLRLSGSGNSYTGSLTTRTNDGNTVRLAIRDLTMTSNGSSQSFEGKVDCQNFGFGGWEHFDVIYYPNDSNGEEMIQILWGCTIEDPPNMYRR